MRFLQEHKKHIAIGGGLLMALLASYYLGKSQAEKADDNIMAEVEQLRANESDAAIVKRVSQQMENIAYQQKAISDKQRDRAEEQSQLALQMRDRAEHESRMARQAEQKAIELAQQAEASAQEAQAQRTRAMEHQQEAEIQRDEATRAKSVSDTLSYRTLGRTLGYSALTQYDSGQTELSRLLAYAGWYFMDAYKGNTYQTDVFNALVSTSGAKVLTQMQQRGGVTALQTIGENQYVAVSDYGEIELHSTATTADAKVLLQNNTYNFRDVYAVDDRIYALSLHGPLCVLDNKRQVKIVELPSDTYMNIVPMRKPILLLIGKHSWCWYNMNTSSLSDSVSFPDILSAMVKRDNCIQLFFENGTYAEMDNVGQVTMHEPLVSQVVTAAHYDSHYGDLYLGCKNGDIEMIDANGNRISLATHYGQILSLTTLDDILVSTSYDHTLYIWYLPFIAEVQEAETNHANSGRKVQFPRHKQVGTSLLEWYTPAGLTFESGWPLSVCRLGTNEIIAGGSNGQIMRLNVSVPDMSAKVKNTLTRNLTREEWRDYIGQSIPYQAFQ